MLIHRNPEGVHGQRKLGNFWFRRTLFYKSNLYFGLINLHQHLFLMLVLMPDVLLEAVLCKSFLPWENNNAVRHSGNCWTLFDSFLQIQQTKHRFWKKHPRPANKLWLMRTDRNAISWPTYNKQRNRYNKTSQPLCYHYIAYALQSAKKHKANKLK